MTRYFKLVDWKITYPAETLKMFCNAHEEDLVPSIVDGKTNMSEPEYKMPVYVIPGEGESVRPNKNSKTSEFT